MFLKIDPEFRSLIPPANKKEDNLLEENMLAEGCLDPLIAMGNILVKGHRRYGICRKHGIPFKVEQITFPSRTEAMIWIIKTQLGRRHLSAAARIELEDKLAELERGRARENQSIGGKTKTEGAAGAPINVREHVADAAGVSGSNVHKFMKIKASGDPELLGKVRSGETKIGTAYKVLESTSVTTILDSSMVPSINKSKAITPCEQAMCGFTKLRKLYEFVDDTLSQPGNTPKRSAGIKKELEEHLGDVVWILQDGRMKMRNAA